MVTFENPPRENAVVLSASPSFLQNTPTSNLAADHQQRGGVW